MPKPIHKSVFDFLDTLPPKQAQQISQRILKLFNEPLPVDLVGKRNGSEVYKKLLRK